MDESRSSVPKLGQGDAYNVYLQDLHALSYDKQKVLPVIGWLLKDDSAKSYVDAVAQLLTRETCLLRPMYQQLKSNLDKEYEDLTGMAPAGDQLTPDSAFHDFMKKDKFGITKLKPKLTSFTDTLSRLKRTHALLDVAGESPEELPGDYEDMRVVSNNLCIKYALLALLGQHGKGDKDGTTAKKIVQAIKENVTHNVHNADVLAHEVERFEFEECNHHKIRDICLESGKEKGFAGAPEDVPEPSGKKAKGEGGKKRQQKAEAAEPVAVGASGKLRRKRAKTNP